MGHHTGATYDMAQVVPIKNMPGSDIPPAAQAGQPHHGQPPDSPEEDGAVHLRRDSRSKTNLRHPQSTSGLGSTCQEKISSRTVGLTGSFPVQNRRRTGA